MGVRETHPDAAGFGSACSLSLVYILLPVTSNVSESFEWLTQ